MELALYPPFRNVARHVRKVDASVRYGSRLQMLLEGMSITQSISDGPIAILLLQYPIPARYSGRVIDAWG